MRAIKTSVSTILAIGLLAGSVGVAAQDEAPEPVGFGGRVEVPEAGFAITLPDDWIHVRPQASDVDTILEAVDALDPDLASMVQSALGAGAFSITLMGFAPVLPGSFAENCNVVTGPTDGMSLELIAGLNLAQMNAIGWTPEDPTTHELPVGDVARIDYGANFGGPDIELTLWLYVDGETQQNLTCTSMVRPEDNWLSIAETLEFLPSA